jgi:lipopolysaccharide heptosyltransferase I
MPQATLSLPRILVIKLSSLGDLFHALPVIRHLKQELNATIDWVTQTPYVDLVKCFLDVNRVIAFPRRDFLKQSTAFVRDLRREKYDLILDLQGLLKSALVARIARGRKRIGPSFAREGSRLFYSAVAGPKNKNRHAVDEILDVIRYFGREVLKAEFPVAFPKTPRPEPKPRVAFIPCSRWRTKNWPSERFVEVGRILQERAGAAIFLAGSPEDRPACDRIEKGLGGRVVNACGKTSLVELGSLLQEMDLTIAVDSGPMHMAAAVGRPVLAVFGATDPKRTGPYGESHRVVALEGLECRPCFSDRCARHDFACLRDLPAERVITQALDLLKANR